MANIHGICLRNKFEYFKEKLKKKLRESLIKSRIYSVDKVFPEIRKSYRMLTESVATPEAQYMNTAKPFEYLKSDTYTTPDIYTMMLKQVIYYPNPLGCDLILTKSRKIIEEALYSKDKFMLDTIKMSQLSQIELERITGICSIFRTWGRGGNYYHTLIEAVPRLYLLNQLEYQYEEIKLLFPSEPTETEKYFISKLAPENIKITLIENPYKLYALNQLIFTNRMTRSGSGFLPSIYLKYFLERVAPKRERNKTERIFISRTKAPMGRTIKNEDELFDALKRYGFKRYLLEDLPLERQIELFYDANYVVAPHGAGLSNIIFSERIKILELFNHKVRTHYYFLAKSLGHAYTYHHGYPEDLSFNSFADYTVNVAEVVERLESLDNGF